MERLTPKDRGEAVALFRAEVIGSLARREMPRGELAAALREIAAVRFRPPGGDTTRTYAVPTLQRWYYALRRGGLDALVPRPRTDRGRGRALTPAQRDLLLEIRREHPRASVPLILRTLVADGRLAPRSVSAPTVRRLYREHGLDRRARRDASARIRLRWQAERPGALWHGDVCHAGVIVIDGKAHPVRIHALLDDASRYVVALEAHHSEREVDMLGLLVRALRRHGPPDALYLDNGSTYRGDILRTACARLGISLLHARPFDHLHILLNYEWDRRALLSLVLVGLPELHDRLALRRNRALYSRIHRRLHLDPLVPDDTAEYLRVRLAAAGCERELFSSDAVAMLHEATLGALRDIDRLATAALRETARKKRKLVERDVIARVVEADSGATS